MQIKFDCHDIKFSLRVLHGLKIIFHHTVPKKMSKIYRSF